MWALVQAVAAKRTLGAHRLEARDSWPLTYVQISTRYLKVRRLHERRLVILGLTNKKKKRKEKKS